MAYVAWPLDPNKRAAPLPLAGAAAGCPCSSSRGWDWEVRDSPLLPLWPKHETEASWVGRHGR